MSEELKTDRARRLIKAVPIIRKAINDYLDELLISATFYLQRKEKGDG